MTVHLTIKVIALVISLANPPLNTTGSKRLRGQPLDVDPKTTVNLIYYANNERVAKEIGLSEDESKAIDQFLEDCFGVPSNLSVPPEMAKRGDREEQFLYYESVMAARLTQVKELVDPSQLERLEQIAYQVELQKKGVYESIMNGYLGRDLQFDDHQRTAFKTIANEIDSEFNDKFADTKKAYWAKIAELLDEDIAKIFYAIFKQPVYIQSHEFFHSQKDGKAIPDMDTSSGPLFLIQYDEVIRFLPQLKERKDKILNVAREADKNIYFIEFLRSKKQQVTPEEEARARLSADQLVRSVVSKDELDYLRNIGWQLELARIGLVAALSEGRLGKKLSIEKDWLDKNKDKLISIENEFDSNSLRLVEMAQSRLVKELSPIQQIELRKLVGKPFLYKPQGIKLPIRDSSN